MSSFSRHALVWFALAAATAVLARFDRYVPVGPELLADPNLQASLSGWRVVDRPGGSVRVEPGAVALTVGEAPCTTRATCVAAVRAEAPSSDADYALLSADLAFDGVVKGRRTDRGPSLFFATRTPGGPLAWDQAYRPLVLEGSAPWRRYEQVVPVGRDDPTWVMEIALSATEGTLRVRDASLRPAREHPGWAAVGLALSVAWAGALAAGARSALLRGRGWARFGVIGAAALILVGTTLPRPVLDPVREAIAVYTMPEAPAPEVTVRPEASIPPSAASSTDAGPSDTAPPPPPAPHDPPGVDPNDLGHLLGFTLLALSAALAWPGHRAVLPGLLGFALATEAMQVLTLARTAEAADLLTDGVGALIGYAVARVVMRVRATSTRSGGM